MVFALIKAQCISLFRDRMAMLLSFALPCVMFTVFAIIFGSGPSGAKTGKLKVIVLDLDATRSSRQLVTALEKMENLEVTLIGNTEQPEDSSTGSAESNGKAAGSDARKEAAFAVRGGAASAAVILPKGLAASLGQFGQADRPAIELICDSANPLAEQMLTGVLQAAAFTSSPEVLMEKGLEQFRTLGGPFSPMQEAAAGALGVLLHQQESSADSGGDNGTDVSRFSMSDGIIRIEAQSAREIVQGDESKNSQVTSAKMISYYAAGISVMFVMFSMSGAASSLLEHDERGTLERLLSGRMTITHLLLSHWAFYVGLGVVQISLMFVFAAVVFGLDLWHLETLAGAGIMALVSSMASAAFVMMIATLCKSRKQLEGLSSVVILIMSAIGGSMMPRFIMPEFVVKLSSVAFNAWAMDGFLKVFWYNTPDQSIVSSIAREVTVILGMAVVFLLAACVAARKWAVR